MVAGAAYVVKRQMYRLGGKWECRVDSATYCYLSIAAAAQGIVCSSRLTNCAQNLLFNCSQRSSDISSYCFHLHNYL